MYVSHSSVQDYMTCPRLYFYKRIRKLELIVFNIKFFIGTIVHVGIGGLLSKVKEPLKLMHLEYERKRKEDTKKFGLSVEQLNELNEIDVVSKGMVSSYESRYGAFLKAFTPLHNEEKLEYTLNENITVVTVLDNVIVKTKNKENWLHEFKTSKYITLDYILSVQADMQTAIGFHLWNILRPKTPLKGIVYDIVRKPSIRQKKTETKEQYLERLGEWYNGPNDTAVFHMEQKKQPLITVDALMNTLTKVTDNMTRSKHKEDYYQDFRQCHSYYGDHCPFYALCHEGGETKENLLQFRTREKYVPPTTTSKLVRK